MSTALETAWRLSRAPPGCEPITLDDVGHGPGKADLLVAVTDRMANRTRQ
ncbi:hypothetical protein [Nonomuraea turcica]|nr:hypothetical protein [Nonomuraea sp. G32]MDP4510938.1 hypothetical protein [Nonomuraea sp. G32]